MFTLDQIHSLHQKVKSGADFPNYIKELKELGVLSYEAFVDDGHIMYQGPNSYTIQSIAKYAPLLIANTIDEQKFKSELMAHQQGKTDYITFIRMCAETGIYKWIIDLNKMTCSYYDKKGNEILVEQIPNIL